MLSKKGSILWQMSRKGGVDGPHAWVGDGQGSRNIVSRSSPVKPSFRYEPQGVAHAGTA